MDNLQLYWEFIKIRLKRLIEYRVAFLTGSLAQTISYGTMFILIWIMINKFKTLAGWNSYEVMFLYAMDLCSYALAAFFLFNFSNLVPILIQTGEFDDVLTKPLNPFIHIICREFNIAYFTHLSLSIFIFVICFVKLNINVSPLKLVFFVISILGAALIQAAGLLFTTTPAFWIIQNNSLQNSLFFNLKNFIQYPVSLYNRAIQILLTLIIPFAFINFYPAQFFLNKNDFLMFHPIFQYMTPVLGILLFISAYKFWLFGLKNYKSTGT